MLKIIQPEGWPTPKGYSNGVVSEGGQMLFVGGQIGWNESHVFAEHDFVGQMRQALLNIKAVVEAAEGHMSDITRLTWYVTAKKEYLAQQRDVGRAYREVMGDHYPAMTMVVVSALVEDEALVEIEATAVIGG